MVKILGLDIGGANTKHALIEVQNEKIELLSSSSDYFLIIFQFGKIIHPSQNFLRH